MSTLTKIMRKPITSAIVAIFVGLLVASIILVAAGYDPISSFEALISGMVGKPKYISNVIIKATPLLFTGIAVAFAFRVGLFNIGAEGQYIVGTILAVIVGYSLDLPPVLQIPVVVLVGTAGGAGIGAIIGWLKAQFGINEVITSIMFNWISLFLCNFVVSLPQFHQPNSTSSYPINESGYTTLFYGMKNSEDGAEAIRNIPVIGDAIMRTKVGYEMRAVGFNRDAAQFTGINVKKNLTLCMAISGALCGLAGALTITGIAPHSIATLAAFENNGFNGLSVAFIANCNPVACIPASFLFAGLLYGGQTVQQVVGAPSEIINIVIGTIVFFMALGGVIPMLADHLDHKRAQKAKEEEAKLAAQVSDASDPSQEEANNAH